MAATVFSAIFDRNGHISHHSDYSVIVFEGGAIVAPAIEAMQILKWARSQASRGAGTRNLSAFLDRFENLIARNGCGIGTRGSRMVLSRLVKSMKADSVPMDDWAVPATIEEDEVAAMPPRAPAPPEPKPE